MGKLLSSRIAITSVLILFFGGLGVIGTVEISNAWAYAIWGIAILWFGGLIFYLPQQIKIRDLTCEYDTTRPTRQYEYPVVLSGFMKSRHKDALQDFCLHLSGWAIYPERMAMDTPTLDESVVIDSYYQKFRITFALTEDVLMEGRKTQEKGKAIDWCILLFQLADAKYKTKPFKNHQNLSKN